MQRQKLENKKEIHRADYFSFEPGGDEFIKAVGEDILISFNEMRNQFICPENVHSYLHGRKWVSLDSYKPNEENEFKKHEQWVETKFQDILNFNLSIFPEKIEEMKDKLKKDFSELFFGTISQACEESGNSFNREKDEPMYISVIEAFGRIEFGVNKYGEVSIPQLALGEGQIQKLLASMKSFHPDLGEKTFNDTINTIIKQKKRMALERNAERLNKFKKNK